MKAIYTFLLLGTLCLGLNTRAQNVPPKPEQFGGYAARLNCTETQLATLLNLPVNSLVDLQLAGGFRFLGTVQASEQRYSNLKTVIIRSTNFPGSVFSLSLRHDQFSAAQYIGRILSFQHSDAYELLFENGQYVLAKKKLEHLVQPCNKQ